jgi:NADPH:quinone reductase-like Zn-dependent oxidoreductase
VRALTFWRYGSPDVLTFSEVAKPDVPVGEVRIRVHTTSVNRTDCAYLSARPFVNRFFMGLFRPKRHILGNEFAGIVEVAGADVSEFAPGDRVFGISPSRLATHAEWVALPASGAITQVPDGLSLDRAGAIADGAMLSLMALRHVPVSPGQRVLILGGAGSMGSAGVQLAKHFGAHVTATCSAGKRDVVRSLGADEVIDYRATDIASLPDRFDVIFDAVGKHSYLRVRHLLREPGVFVPTDFGFLGQNFLLVPFTLRSRRRRISFIAPSPRRADMDFLRDLIASGAYTPVIDRTFTFDDIVEAFRYVRTGHKTGNVAVVLVPDA